MRYSAASTSSGKGSMSGQGLDSREQLVHAVVLLCSQGMSRRAIARSLGIARKTASRILRSHQAARSEAHTALPARPARAPRSSKLDEFKGAAQRLLESFPDITAQRVFEELRGKGFCGGYTAVKLLVRKLRPKPRIEPSWPTPSYGPGKMAECDWSPYTIEFTQAPARTLQGFAYALVYSHRKYFDFFERCDLHALMDGHVGAFGHYGGATHTIKYDVQKPVVLRFEGRQPIYNPRFVDFATYYEHAIEICRPGHPNDKPRVERSFGSWNGASSTGAASATRPTCARNCASGWPT